MIFASLVRDFSERFRYARRRRPGEDNRDSTSVSPILMETVDPEDKRKIIGDTFMEVRDNYCFFTFDASILFPGHQLSA